MTYDKQLYSRQEFTVGSDAQSKLANAEVILVGLSGLGIEIAKNLVLLGIRKLALIDNGTLALEDLSTNFFAKESDIGKKRADLVVSGLSELNPTVKLKAMVNSGIDDISLDLLKDYSIVIVVNHPFSSPSVISLNKLVRSNGKGFILAENYGVSAVIFVDFGPAFKVLDSNGEVFPTCNVTSIGSDGRVNLGNDQQHSLERGDVIEFRSLQEPLRSLNGKRIFVQDILSPYAFTIAPESSHDYHLGGQVTGRKQEKVFCFECLEKQINNPTIVPADFAKMHDGLPLHAFFRSIHAFQADMQHLPMPFDDVDAEKVVEKMKKSFLAERFPEAEFKRLAMATQGEFIGITSFIGGLAAHEALKGICGKFTPLCQFYYFDARELLPSNDLWLTMKSIPQDRYISQAKIFGPRNSEFVKKKYFIVGAGALGCELLKNFVMAGLGASSCGEIIITDMDTIEKSNLSRQFLFRSTDLGFLKSQCAAKRGKEMNSNANITWLQEKVSDETADLFNDSFWENIDGVCTALDNVQSRQWVDGKCVYYKIPLLDSGTLGSSANSQVVIPDLTESYSSSADPPEKAIPVCTLKNFPTKIEHTIQWARDAFEGLFCTQINQTKQYLANPREFLEQLERDQGSREAILDNVEFILKSNPKTYHDCLKMACKLFSEYFTINIRDLLASFPPDAVTTEGKPFWTSSKKMPAEIEYQSENAEHHEFILTSSALFAQAFSIQKCDFLAKDAVEIFHEYTNSKIASSKSLKQKNRITDAHELQCDLFISHLQKYQYLEKKLVPISFEKDDDSNHHVSFVKSCSNLRAKNYGIEPIDFYTTKRIAGRIIPAMITTTASIVGLVMIELAKLIVQEKSQYKIEHFKNSFVNFAIAFTAFSEPLPPKRVTYGTAESPQKYEWTIWDKFEIDFGRDVTIKELLDYLHTRYQIDVSMLSCGVSIVYSIFSDKSAEILTLLVSHAVRQATQKDIPPYVHYLDFEILCSIDDVDVDVPPIRYKFCHSA